MKRITTILLGAALMLASASVAVADEEDQCAASCPNGQRLVGFSDGNRATCQCHDPGDAMVETVQEPADFPDPSFGEPTAATAPDPVVNDPVTEE